MMKVMDGPLFGTGEILADGVCVRDWDWDLNCPPVGRSYYWPGSQTYLCTTVWSVAKGRRKTMLCVTPPATSAMSLGRCPPSGGLPFPGIEHAP